MIAWNPRAGQAPEIRAAFRPPLIDDPAEWTAPFLCGGGRVERRMRAEHQRRGLLLPNRASAAKRRLMAARDTARPRSLPARLTRWARGLVYRFRPAPGPSLPRHAKGHAAQPRHPRVFPVRNLTAPPATPAPAEDPACPYPPCEPFRRWGVRHLRYGGD